MKNRIISLLLALVMLVGMVGVFASCGEEEPETPSGETCTHVDKNGDGLCDNCVDEDGDGIYDNKGGENKKNGRGNKDEAEPETETEANAEARGRGKGKNKR